MPLFAHNKKDPPQHKHAYLSGNFAPIDQTLPLTPCTYEGTIPSELAGGEYVRNGGNPVKNEDLGRDAHWFDGDGMLSGVSFTRQSDGSVQPEFVNQYILTDIFLSTAASPRLRSPILPSIATLVNPLSSLVAIVLRILRTVVLVILSFLPGSTRAIKRISVANTSILYHDGRALATCESGPPMRIALPGLETIGWYDGNRAEGEPESHNKNDLSFSGNGLLGFLREWTTAHPKVDPITKEMMLFHSTFLPPYVQYSIISPTSARSETNKGIVQRPVPGITGAKMMHDFGVSLKHTIIMDLPLSLDPFNLAKNKPVIEYDATKPARFGVFPRHHPEQVKYFETTACCIFHTANAWDDFDASGQVETVHLLTCRLTSACLVFSAGNIAAPRPTNDTVKAVKKSMPFFSKYNADEQCLYEGAPGLESPSLEREPLIQITGNHQDDASYFGKQEDDDEETIEDDQCRLYHYAFSLKSSQITAQYALSGISFEFPSVHPEFDMQKARYVYGCTTSISSFNAALGRSVKIDALAKIDTKALIETGDRLTELGKLEPVTGCVDTRTVQEIADHPLQNDPIQIFRMPAGWYAQEPRFVPRKASPGQTSAEDDGFLLAYAFDESQLGPDGEVPSDEDATVRAKSELWIIDAKDMNTVVGRVALPQRVPYGLHGTWFPEENILGQKAVETVRSISEAKLKKDGSTWMKIRASIEGMLS
ncbi:carotenoid oxygenase [Aureobasidium namibiae CBS 147.97]|uniref:Carotenoid oxygenase n=1 Tax=Aureobasidium namibiae CBS 147.97 TaxID=1043004 RepID=A0A074X986_9PEZI